VEWILLFILGIMVALLLTSISRRKGYDPEENELDEDVPRSKKRKEDDKLSLGWLVWLFMGLILLAAILGLVLDPRFR
jgi:phosphate/sulfate permease